MLFWKSLSTTLSSYFVTGWIIPADLMYLGSMPLVRRNRIIYCCYCCVVNSISLWLRQVQNHLVSSMFQALTTIVHQCNYNILKVTPVGPIIYYLANFSLKIHHKRHTWKLKMPRRLNVFCANVTTNQQQLMWKALRDAVYWALCIESTNIGLT